ncbi:MAG: acyl--CoA ligase [Bacteroidales bacterium]|nr:acyl--CoA ligase [Bacteroidales bacterium]
MYTTRGAQLLTQLNFRQIFFKRKRFDRQTVMDSIDHLAKYLNTHIRSSSPFVLLTAYNHIKTLTAYYAILKTGRIPAIMDPGCRSIELTEIIEDIDPAAIIFINASEIGFHYDEELIFRNQKSVRIINADMQDVCTLAYTNAEDGFSKGAMLTEKNLLAEIHALITTNRLTDRSVTCALLPFSHLYGLVQGILVPTHAGCSGVIIELDILKINEIIQQIGQHQVTHLYTVPSLYYLFSKIPGIKSYVSDVQEFYSGGAQLTPFIFNSFYQKTDRKIREGYGLTEGSPGVALNYGEEDPVMNSIGKPLPGCEIKIFDDDSRECFPGNIGEICIKGDMVFKGYFHHDEATTAVLRNGWLHTGDYGRKDLQGNIYFCGLKKNMINVAGNNVYPKKLERMIRINKNVDDIKVYSEESVLQGQVVGARIRLKNASRSMEEELKKWCYDNINHILLPKIWLFE